MKHDPIMRERWLHPLNCGCSRCAPARPGLTALDRVSLQIVAGLVLGLLLTFIIDWLLGWPVYGL